MHPLCLQQQCWPPLLIVLWREQAQLNFRMRTVPPS